MGFRGFRFRVWDSGLGLRVQEFMVEGLLFRVEGVGFRVQVSELTGSIQVNDGGSRGYHVAYRSFE